MCRTFSNLLCRYTVFVKCYIAFNYSTSLLNISKRFKCINLISFKCTSDYVWIMCISPIQSNIDQTREPKP